MKFPTATLKRLARESIKDRAQWAAESVEALDAHLATHLQRVAARAFNVARVDARARVTAADVRAAILADAKRGDAELRENHAAQVEYCALLEREARAYRLALREAGVDPDAVKKGVGA